jgi:hypothetical protein
VMACRAVLRERVLSERYQALASAAPVQQLLRCLRG